MSRLHNCTRFYAENTNCTSYYECNTNCSNYSVEDTNCKRCSIETMKCNCNNINSTSNMSYYLKVTIARVNLSEPHNARVSRLLIIAWQQVSLAFVLLHLHRFPYCSKICCSVKADELPRLVPSGLMNSSFLFPLKLPIRPVI